jgi:hypothetical protein
MAAYFGVTCYFEAFPPQIYSRWFEIDQIGLTFQVLLEMVDEMRNRPHLDLTLHAFLEMGLGS